MGSCALLLLLACYAGFTWTLSVAYYTNLLYNPSFELGLSGNNNWKSNGFTMTRTQTNVKEGAYSLTCTGR
jgi:hypothetical protein